jgi:hypothetical protein
MVADHQEEALGKIAEALRGLEEMEPEFIREFAKLKISALWMESHVTEGRIASATVDIMTLAVGEVKHSLSHALDEIQQARSLADTLEQAITGQEEPR